MSVEMIAVPGTVRKLVTIESQYLGELIAQCSMLLLWTGTSELASPSHVNRMNVRRENVSCSSGATL